MNNYKIYSYIIYLVVGLVVTFFVGRDLNRKGYHLILDLFGNIEFTTTVNNLLLVLYYLLNMGCITVAMLKIGEVTSLNQMLEELTTRIGLILFILGSLHFNNIFMLQLLSKRKQKIIQFFNH